VGESGRERAKWALLQFSYSTLLSEWYMDWMDGIGVVLFWSRVGESRVQMRTNERYDETRWGGVFCLVLSCLVVIILGYLVMVPFFLFVTNRMDCLQNVFLFLVERARATNDGYGGVIIDRRPEVTCPTNKNCMRSQVPVGVCRRA
jgi:hypothetical protein